MNNFHGRQQSNNTDISASQQYFYFKYYYKLNNKTNLLEDFVNFVDRATEKITYLRIIITLFTNIISLLLFFLIT